MIPRRLGTPPSCSRATHRLRRQNNDDWPRTTPKPNSIFGAGGSGYQAGMLTSSS
jgi:hypothetical protein